MKPKYSIIITTKNEECGIAKVLCDIPEEIEKQSEIIVVDSSKDLTPKIAERLGAMVIREPKRGKGRAMKTGVEQSHGDTLIFLDGDGTDPPQYIPELIKKLKNHDLVLGSRVAKNFKQDSKIYRVYFLPYQLVVGTLFKEIVGFKISGDPLAGFRAIKRKNWDTLKLESDGFEIEAEMNIKALKNGLKIGEIPIPLIKRSGGLLKSKLVTSPKMQLKIFDVALRYVEEEKIRVNLIRLRKELKESVWKNRFKKST